MSSLNQMSHEMANTSLAKKAPKKKAKAKAAALRSGQASPEPVRPQIPSEVDKPKKREQDIELQKLDLKRKKLVLTSKWMDRISDLNTEVSFALDQCKGMDDCAERLGFCRLFLLLLLLRLSWQACDCASRRQGLLAWCVPGSIDSSPSYPTRPRQSPAATWPS